MLPAEGPIPTFLSSRDGFYRKNNTLLIRTATEWWYGDSFGGKARRERSAATGHYGCWATPPPPRTSSSAASLHTGGLVPKQEGGLVVRLDRRTYSPLLRQAGLLDVAVPWRGGRRLRFE